MRTWPQKPPLGTPLDLGHPLSQGIFVAMPMNEGSGSVINDLSGNENHATLLGNALWSPGKFGVCPDLDGTGDYAKVTTLKNANNINEGTVSFWMYYRSGVNYDGFITTEQTVTTAAHILIFANSTTYAVRVSIGSSGGVAYAVTATNTIMNAWVNYTLTYNTQVCRLYQNGIFNVQDLTPTYALDRVSNNLFIGIDRGSGGRDIDGMMDNVLLWNRALTASEVAWLYREPFAMYQRRPIELWTAVSTPAVSPWRQRVIMVA